VRVATLLPVDKQVVAGTWDHRTLSAPGGMLPIAIPGTIGIGVFLEVEVEPDDYSPQQLDVWIYVRGVDETLGVVDEVIDLLHVIDGVVAPIGEIAEPVIQRLDIWIPSYPVDTPRQLWFEARLENVTQAERAVSLVPEI
jgi:hypothetical protein